jgi:mono/diheme cytochrome c family protein
MKSSVYQANRSPVARLFVFVLLIISTPAWLNADVAAGEDAPVDFETQIAPIFAHHCVRCHSPEADKNALSLATFTDLKENEFVVAGDPEASHLLQLITPIDGQPPEMPKEGARLSEEQILLIRRWITEGAIWPADFIVRLQSKADGSWWSLQPIASTKLPASLVDTQSQHPIDLFVRAKLHEHGLSPAAPADRRTLIRRLSFDLLGLPPSPEEVKAFETDPDPRAYEKLVDRLLASKHFGERWARHWLDIAHYADTHGFERDKLRDNAWHYRDYVIRALNEDKPYDQFLREQIAGDVIAPDNIDAVYATGFLAAGPWDFVGQVETKSSLLRRSARALDLDDMVTQVMTASVAMTVNCARCHDHKLDPILQKEYYQLTAVFAGLKRDDREVNPRDREKYGKEKLRLEQAISVVAAEIGHLEGQHLDLADIVGGGNGYGSGQKGNGIDARTGKVHQAFVGDLDQVQPGNFATSEFPFVDGVFIPAGDQTQISSTELIASALPENSGKAWDMIRNGPVNSQFSTKLGAIDFNSAGHSLLGLHANAGITFDLQAIREATSKNSAMTFSAIAGYGGMTVEPSAEFWVLLDGELKVHKKIGREDAIPIVLEMSESARFLTLISTDGGNGYSHDQICFGDPQLKFVDLQKVTQAESKKLTELKSRREQLEIELKQLVPPHRFYGVVAEQPAEVHLLVRGNPETPGVVVAPGTLSLASGPTVFGAADMNEGQRRLALANWITDPQNPLTARVIVNRLWHWHFGRGIVGTPSDFGFGGERPTHPELLDWLAGELIRSNWSLKHIHRLIVTSQTYQMQSNSELQLGDDSAAINPHDIDHDNHLLWRMNARRLEAEAIRDSVLVATGKLNFEMYGPGYRDFDYEEAYAPIYTYTTADKPELWRRSIYRFIVRTTPQPFLTTMDCPDPANLTPDRNVTTTALQSLALFNNDFMLRQARYFSERLAREADTVDAQIELAFQLAFARSVREDELIAARQLISEQGMMHLCRVLFNANEFVYVD